MAMRPSWVSTWPWYTACIDVCRTGGAARGGGGAAVCGSARFCAEAPSCGASCRASVHSSASCASWKRPSAVQALAYTRAQPRSWNVAGGPCCKTWMAASALACARLPARAAGALISPTDEGEKGNTSAAPPSR